MNRRQLFRLAGAVAVAVAPRAMLAAPVAPTGDYVFFAGDRDVSALPTHFVGRLEYVRRLMAAGVIEGYTAVELLDGA